jgi:UDP-N-acetylmuramate dehydrogenase
MSRLSAPDPGSFVRYNVELAPFTTWGVGGVAETFLAPGTSEELVTAVRWLHANRSGFYTLGGGSNVLISDGAIERPVLLTTGARGITVRQNGEYVFLECMAGVYIRDILVLAVREGWSGFEFTAGIPGTVGGAVAGNSGTADGNIGSVVEGIRTIETDGSVLWRNTSEIEWGYRNCSLFRESARVALAVILKLVQSDHERVSDLTKAAMLRRNSQPVKSRTAGCVFRNPKDDSAGRLLDASGCKGMSVGGARVSEVHANFIENIGGCTASDILTLAEKCRKRVFDVFGTPLRFEIKTLGFADASSDG